MAALSALRGGDILARPMQPVFFDSGALEARARAHASAYAAAAPFPHAILDGLVPETLLDAVLAEVPAPDDPLWSAFRSDTSHKLACFDENQLGPSTRHLLAQLNSSTFVTFLEALTGIEGLIPDPHLHGGGLHLIERGGRLEIHADFNRHKTLGLERRLNLLLYLNKDWEEQWGGQLELWPADMSQCAVRVVPAFNRAVVFTTSETSYHGHPEPLACPAGRARTSLAVYYYSHDRPDGAGADWHTTQYQLRPGQKPLGRSWPQRVARALRRRVRGR